MANELDEQILEQLYTWIDSIPLTRPKKDLKRDFSDGGTTNLYAVSSAGWPRKAHFFAPLNFIRLNFIKY